MPPRGPRAAPSWSRHFRVAVGLRSCATTQVSAMVRGTPDRPGDTPSCQRMHPSLGPPTSSAMSRSRPMGRTRTTACRPGARSSPSWRTRTTSRSASVRSSRRSSPEAPGSRSSASPTARRPRCTVSRGTGRHPRPGAARGRGALGSPGSASRPSPMAPWPRSTHRSSPRSPFVGPRAGRSPRLRRDGVTGHPDHRRATEAALAFAAGKDLPVLGWALPASVAGSSTPTSMPRSADVTRPTWTCGSESDRMHSMPPSPPIEARPCRDRRCGAGWSSPDPSSMRGGSAGETGHQREPQGVALG